MTERSACGLIVSQINQEVDKTNAMKETDETRPRSRKEREKQNRRAEILLAARQVLARRGFTDATLDEIAVAAEYGKATLYNYFQNKEELYDAVIHDGLEYIHSLAVEACGEATETAETQYLRFAELMYRTMYQHSEMIPLIMREMHTLPMRSRIAEAMRRINSVLARPLERDMRNKRIHKVSAERVVMLFIPMLVSLYKTSFVDHGTSHLCLFEPPPITDPQELQRMIDGNCAILRRTFFHGLLLPAA